MILSIQLLYILVGIILAITSVMTLAERQHPKRYTSAFFWGLYALVFLIGDQLPPTWVGLGVIAMAVIAGLRGVGVGQHTDRTPAWATSSSSRRWRSRW